MLGIALLRKGARPRSAAWLLTLTFPLAIGISMVTSTGSLFLPVLFAFGLLGRRIARAEPQSLPAALAVSA